MAELTSDIAKRIEFAMECYSVLTGKKLTWAALARAIGYTPQAPTNWKKGKVGLKVIYQIAEFLGGDEAWLMHGSAVDAEIFQVPKTKENCEKYLPRFYDRERDFDATEYDASSHRFIDKNLKLSDNHMSIIENKYFSTQKTSFSNVSEKIEGVKFVPVISFVQAGTFKEAILNAQENFVACYVENLSGDAFALEVKGDSMSPEFKAGDKIIVDPEVLPLPGDYVIAQNGEHEATFKKYRPRGYDAEGQVIFELTPLNPDYPVLNSSEQSIRIIGTVVEHIRSLKRRSS